MKPSKYFGTSEGLVELRPSKTDDGLTMYRPVTYPCPDGLERYQGFALQARKFQTVVSLGIGADAEMIAHAPEDIAALVAEVERLRGQVNAVKAAVANHPDQCEKHPDGDAVSCGWKTAYKDVVRALEAA